MKLAAEIYIFFKIAGLAETLQQIGVSPEVEAFVISNPNKATKSIALLKENPALTVEELKISLSQPEKKIEQELKVPAEYEDDLNTAISAHSKNKKHRHWILKQLEKGYSINDIIPTLDGFYKEQDKLVKKDLTQYDLKELEDELKNISFSKRQQKAQDLSGGSKKLYEDGEWKLFRIESKNACQILGKNTKWCITTADQSYYEQYSGNNVIFYFLLKKNITNQEDAYNKIAFAYERDLNNQVVQIEIFDALDDHIGNQEVSKIVENYSTIKSIMDSDAPVLPKSILARIGSGEASKEEMTAALNGEIPNIDTESAVKLISNINRKPSDEMMEVFKVLINKAQPSDLDNILEGKFFKYFISSKYNYILPDDIIDLMFGKFDTITLLNSLPTVSDNLMDKLIDLFSDNLNILNVISNRYLLTLPQVYRLIDTKNQTIQDNVLYNFGKLYPQIIDKLIELGNSKIKRQIVYDHKLTFDQMLELSTDDDDYVREAVASNVSTPPEILDSMADDSWQVLIAIVKNKNATIDTILKIKNKLDNNQYAKSKTWGRNMGKEIESRLN